MQRREFILWGGQTALLAAFSPPSLATDDRLQITSSHNHTTEPLAKELEKLIPKLMRDAKVPVLSITLVRNGQLS